MQRGKNRGLTSRERRGVVHREVEMVPVRLAAAGSDGGSDAVANTRDVRDDGGEVRKWGGEATSAVAEEGWQGVCRHRRLACRRYSLNSSGCSFENSVGVGRRSSSARGITPMGPSENPMA